MKKHGDGVAAAAHAPVPVAQASSPVAKHDTGLSVVGGGLSNAQNPRRIFPDSEQHKIDVGVPNL